MSQRLRVGTLLVIGLLLITATTAYIARSRADQQAAETTPQQTMPASAVGAGPRIVFRNSAIGPDYGKVAMVPLADPSGPRAITPMLCDRVFAVSARTLCLASSQGLVTTYTARVYDNATGQATAIPLTGSPSRARLSTDGTLAATTSFVAGDSYASSHFSTRTVVSQLTQQGTLNLEEAKLIHQGQVIAPPDRNFWGVTFASDDDHFYATVAFGGSTWLARGQVSTRTIETIRQDAECPSLSPNGTKVAFKTRGDRNPGDWRLVVLDLQSGVPTQLAENRSVDDQVEWLDDSRVVYGLPGEGSSAGEANIWVVNADGTGSPWILVPRGWSPGVVR